MIVIPQSILRDCYSVFRRAVPNSTTARSTASVHIVGGRDGLRLRMVGDVSIEFYHRTSAEAVTFSIPLNALSDCAGRGNGSVTFQSSRDGRVQASWEQSGIPNRRDYTASGRVVEFPAWPGRDLGNKPSLLSALDAAMQIPVGGAGRISLTHIQLRGKEGDICATDGRQLLIQGGFKFPWKETVVLPRTSVFAAEELYQGEVVCVARSQSHILFRAGPWTVAIAIATAVRFPDVNAVIPKPSSNATRWFVSADEAAALSEMLDKLPGAGDEHAPITLDLGRSVVIRAQAENDKRCTEVAVPRSRTESKPVRVAMDRRILKRALDLGFSCFQITASDKPILCQDENRVFVWVVLSPENTLKPQPGAARVMLPRGNTESQAIDPASTFNPPAPAAAVDRPSRVVGRFFERARSLWDLVRRHHEQQQVK
jgi:hypothetical protein